MKTFFLTTLYFAAFNISPSFLRAQDEFHDAENAQYSDEGVHQRNPNADVNSDNIVEPSFETQQSEPEGEFPPANSDTD